MLPFQTTLPKDDVTKAPLDQIARDAGTEIAPKKKVSSKQRGLTASASSAGASASNGLAASLSSAIQKQKEKDPDTSKAALRDTFTLFDANSDGHINFPELRAATRNNKLNLSDADVKLMLRTADKNHDSKVSFDEFHNLMKGRRSSS